MPDDHTDTWSVVTTDLRDTLLRSSVGAAIVERVVSNIYKVTLYPTL
jgi:hypothetical protein